MKYSVEKNTFVGSGNLNIEKDHIYESVSSSTKEAICLSAQLISKASISPSDNGCIDIVANYIQEAIKSKNTSDIPTYKITDLSFGEEEKQTRNAYIEVGSGEKNLTFAGHTDVVPSVNEHAWKYGPFTPTIKNGIIFGRGIVDMKGSLACFLVAMKDLLSSPKHRLALKEKKISCLLTSDEEASGTYGMKKFLPVLKKEGVKLQNIIFGEPTSSNKVGDIIKIGRRGSVNFTLTIFGQAGHIAYPEKAVNPNHLAVNLCKDLIYYNFDNGNEYFDSSLLQIVSIDTGNTVSNIIPEQIKIKFGIRFNNLHSIESLLSIIKKLVSSHAPNYKLDYIHSGNPFICQPNDFNLMLEKAILSTCGFKPKSTTCGGTSDARFAHEYGHCVELGLLNETAHKIDENAKIEDLNTLTQIYSQILLQYLAD